jgi:Alcohol dehydrogenase GroES-like domain
VRLIRLKAPGGLQNLQLAEEDRPIPRPGEVLVRVRASSLNFHDYFVALGKIPSADGRIPMTDGAGEVIALGDGVDEFKVADAVVGTFWPYWLGGCIEWFEVFQFCLLLAGLSFGATKQSSPVTLGGPRPRVGVALGHGDLALTSGNLSLEAEADLSGSPERVSNRTSGNSAL